MSQADYSQMKRYNECFQYKCQTCTVKATCLNPAERPRKILRCGCCDDGLPPPHRARFDAAPLPGPSQESERVVAAPATAPRRGRPRLTASQPAPVATHETVGM